MEGGDLAVDIGAYKSAIAGTNDTGKSVVTWVKRGDKWLILAGMFSSDLPPAPSAPTAAPTTPEATAPATPEPAPPPAPATEPPAPAKPTP